MSCQVLHKGQVNHSMAALLSSLTREREKKTSAITKKNNIYIYIYTLYICTLLTWDAVQEQMGHCAGHSYSYIRRECLLCTCVRVFWVCTLCVPLGQRCSSWCSDRSTVCGVLQHQQPDRGQTVDLWCQGAEMTCFCHWVCAPSREALNYIGTALTDMFVIQSVLKIPSKGYYSFDKSLHSICVCAVPVFPARSTLSAVFVFTFRGFVSHRRLSCSSNWS